MNDSVNKLSGSVGGIPHGAGHSVSAHQRSVRQVACSVRSSRLVAKEMVKVCNTVKKVLYLAG